jgi:hypothetical protein
MSHYSAAICCKKEEEEEEEKYKALGCVKQISETGGKVA